MASVAGEMAMEPNATLGKVCGVCKTYNPIGATTCRECGAVMILGLTAEQAEARRERGELQDDAGLVLAALVARSVQERPGPMTEGMTRKQAGVQSQEHEEEVELVLEEVAATEVAGGHEPDPRTVSRIQGLVAMATSRTSARSSTAGSGLAQVEEVLDRVGTFEPSPMRTCPVCHAPIVHGTRFCGNCGARLVSPSMGSRPAVPTTSGRLAAQLVILKGDGSDGMKFPLSASEQILGRIHGSIVIPEDSYLSPRHARFYYKNNRLYLRDEGSRNGIFLRIRGPVELTTGDLFLAGEELLRFEVFEPPPLAPQPDGTYAYSSPRLRGRFRVVQVLAGAKEGLAYWARHDSVVIGRENADINFPKDPFISRHHTRVEASGAMFLLYDLGSKNGTFIKLRTDREIQNHDYLFMGKTLMRVDLH